MKTFMLLVALAPVLLAAPAGMLNKGGLDITSPTFRFPTPPVVGNRAEILQYIPKELMDFATSLTEEEKKALEKIPQMMKERHIIITLKNMPGLLREVSPSAYEKYQKLIDILETKMKRLSQPTQDFIRKMIDDIDSLSASWQKRLNGDFTTMDAEMMKEVMAKGLEMLGNIIRFFDENPQAQAEVSEQWPEIGLLFKSEIYNYLKTLAKIDPKVFAQLIDISMQMKRKQQMPVKIPNDLSSQFARN